MGKIVLKDGTVYNFISSRDVESKGDFLYAKLRYKPRGRFTRVSLRRTTIVSMNFKEEKVRVERPGITYKKTIKVGMKGEKKKKIYNLADNYPLSKSEADELADMYRKENYYTRIKKVRHGYYGEKTRYLVYTLKKKKVKKI